MELELELELEYALQRIKDACLSSILPNPRSSMVFLSNTPSFCPERKVKTKMELEFISNAQKLEGKSIKTYYIITLLGSCIMVAFSMYYWYYLF